MQVIFTLFLGSVNLSLRFCFVFSLVLTAVLPIQVLFTLHGFIAISYFTGIRRNRFSCQVISRVVICTKLTANHTMPVLQTKNR